MILAIGIGNTNIHAAVGYYGNFTGVSSALSVDFEKFIEDSFGLVWNKIEGSVISSVVPAMTSNVVNLIETKTGKKPVRPDVGRFLSSWYSGIGEDRLVCCSGAAGTYAPPFIMVDFGTATTLNVVGEGGVFLGGAIMTGVKTGLRALSERTAQLPLAAYASENVPVLGTNTQENLIGGAIIGAAGAVEGYISRIWDYLGKETPVIITGGDAVPVLPYLRIKNEYEPDLLFKGLFLTYNKELGKEFFHETR